MHIENIGYITSTIPYYAYEYIHSYSYYSVYKKIERILRRYYVYAHNHL